MRPPDRHRLGWGLSLGATVCLMGCGPRPDSVPAPPPGASAVDPIAGATGPGAGPDPNGAVQPVRLDDMATVRSDPTPEQRNPFRFGGGGPPASFDTAPVLPPLPSQGGALDIDAASAPPSGQWRAGAVCSDSADVHRVHGESRNRRACRGPD